MNKLQWIRLRDTWLWCIICKYIETLCYWCSISVPLHREHNTMGVDTSEACLLAKLGHLVSSKACPRMLWFVSMNIMIIMIIIMPSCTLSPSAVSRWCCTCFLTSPLHSDPLITVQHTTFRAI